MAGQQAYETLIGMGIDEDQALSAVQSIVSNSAVDLSADEIVETALSLLENMEAEESESDGSFAEPHKVVIVIREDLQMSSGKVAAQSGHAIHLLCRGCPEGPALEEWEEGDSGSAIIALAVKNLDELEEVRRRANLVDIPCFPVIDAGRTEVEEGTCTVMAVGPATNEQLKPVTGHLRLYK